MMKMKYIIYLFVLASLLVACNTSNGSSEIQERVKPSVKGVSDVDVVNTHGGVEGVEKMQVFYENTQKGIAADLRIVHYTIEGDPMVTDLSYNGDTIEVKHDTTRDTFGSGQVTTNTCGNMLVESYPTNISYIVTDCKGMPYGMESVLQIDYDMNQQDLFEIELKYGVELENEINTVSNTMKKVINAKELQSKNDFELPESVMQEVYKKLVLMSYLGEKDLQAKCDEEDATNYELKMHLNRGHRDFRWTSCDQSYDGLKLTEIAEYVIEQSEIVHNEIPKVEVQGYVLEIKDNMLLIVEDVNMLEIEWLKVELPQNDLDTWIFDFTNLEGVNTDEFKIGDKVHATIQGDIIGSKPGKAVVKEIEKVN